jgi:methylated-DNA-[protein]-cysteine S-methyltransferase
MTAEVEQFAQATEALRAGADVENSALGPPLLDLARRLRETGEAMPDPAFVETLRADLLAGSGEAAYAPLETPFGRIHLAWKDGRLVAAGREDAEAFQRNVAASIHLRPRPAPAPPPRLAAAVSAHLEGRKRFRGVDISWLPDFQRRVLEKTAEIPRGEVRPYSWIAKELGRPGAARAVGSALGRNPIPFVIPCHRVVRSDGSFGEYSGGGPEVKVRLLEWEGVPVREMAVRARHGIVYTGSRTTRIFCFPTCSSARRTRTENTVAFASQRDAEAAGYRACKRCRPA